MKTVLYTWNTEAVKRLIAAVPGCSVIAVNPKGGDYDTEQVVVGIEGTEEKLFVRGFRTDGKSFPEQDNCDVELTEVTTGYSDGDMPNVPQLMLAQGGIMERLSNHGHCPVKSLDPYF